MLIYFSFFLFSNFFSVFVQCGATESPAHKILVGNQREKTTLGHGFLSFIVYLVTILYCSDIVWSKDLSVYFLCFLLIFDREFSFLFCFVTHLVWQIEMLCYQDVWCIHLMVVLILLKLDRRVFFFIHFVRICCGSKFLIIL